MKDSLILEGKIYISAKRAAEISGYSSDYVGQLCRGGKIESLMVGRTWFVNDASLRAHKVAAEKQALVPSRPQASSEPITQSKPIDVPVPAVAPALASVSKVEPVIAPKPVTQTYTRSYVVPARPLSQTRIAAPAFVTEESVKKISPVAVTAGILTVLVIVMFLWGGILRSANDTRDASRASVATVSEEIIEKMIAFFLGLPQTVAELIDTEKTTVVTKSVSQQDFLNGIVTVPSSGSVSKDDATKARIKNSFSDEVKVTPDTTGSSGIITPVFQKKNEGDSFIYVLVPVDP